MKKAMKLLGVLVLVLAIFFSISIKNSEAVTACYKYWTTYDWGSTWTDTAYMILYDDGTFEYFNDYGYYYDGYWFRWSTTYAFDWYDDCYSFGSGTLAKGFEKCQDGYDIGYWPRPYQMKKLNCRYVPLSSTNNNQTENPNKKGSRLRSHDTDVSSE